MGAPMEVRCATGNPSPVGVVAVSQVCAGQDSAAAMVIGHRTSLGRL